jgi:TRAP-type C4-dicarboxylate transport system substrate-binding protein
MNATLRFGRWIPAIAGMTLLLVATAFAHEHGEQWILANEYPASSLPGEGDEFFAKLVDNTTEGKISIITMPDAKMGYKSREQLRAVGENRIAMADSFGGALGDEEAIFALSSLPFVASDAAQARALYERAKPAYEAAFARHGQKLLYTTPWPPSGLWTKSAANSVEAIASLRIRTYDTTGTEVFKRLGASASVVSFADLPAKLAAGDINAVLSSGDGGAGRKLWEHLPRFTEINYAVPLSFTTVNLARWKALDDDTRGAIGKAAAETEARQWQALEGRLARNYARMRENGMTIDTAVAPALRTRLRESARGAIDEWSARAGPEARALLETR